MRLPLNSQSLPFSLYYHTSYLNANAWRGYTRRVNLYDLKNVLPKDRKARKQKEKKNWENEEIRI